MLSLFAFVKDQKSTLIYLSIRIECVIHLLESQYIHKNEERDYLYAIRIENPGTYIDILPWVIPQYVITEAGIQWIQDKVTIMQSWTSDIFYH